MMEEGEQEDPVSVTKLMFNRWNLQKEISRQWQVFTSDISPGIICAMFIHIEQD